MSRNLIEFLSMPIKDEIPSSLKLLLAPCGFEVSKLIYPNVIKRALEARPSTNPPVKPKLLTSPPTVDIPSATIKQFETNLLRFFARTQQVQGKK